MPFIRPIRVAVRYAACYAVSIGLLLVPVQGAQAQGDGEVLSNATVVQMLNAKLSKDLILGKINSARPGFDLSSTGIMSLISFKVDQGIIKQMLQVADNARRSGTAPSTLVGLDEVLTNEIVVKMLGDKVPKPLVLQKMQMSRTAFDVSAGGMVSLKTSKVPDDVIKAMLLPPAPPASRAVPVKEPTPSPAAADDKGAAKAAGSAAKSKATAKDSAKSTPPRKPPTA